jgi:hypothetical protein
MIVGIKDCSWLGPVRRIPKEFSYPTIILAVKRGLEVPEWKARRL